jgi:tRNA(Met) cytidine acetyltransferase
MLHGLSAPGRELSKRCQRRFARELPDQLADPLRSVTPRVVLALLAGLPQPKLSADQSRERVKAFASGQAEYEDAVAAIVALTPLALSEAAGRFSEAVRQALVLKVLQRRSWADCAAALGVSGRREVITLLRAGFSQLD